MNLIGKWSIVETMQFNEETERFEWVKVSDILAQEDVDEDMVMLLNGIAIFEEDGNLVFLSPLPEGLSQEEIDEAVASGEVELRDGKMVTQQNHWKTEGGKNLADTGAEGEALGEEVGPWEEIKEIDDNTIEMTMFRLRRMIP